ncbi:MAG: hypothetical protein V1849_03460 [Chloroflexota bacterium]
MEWFSQLASRALESVSTGSPGALAALFLVAAFTEVGVPFPFVMDTILFFTSYRAEQVSLWIVFLLMTVLLLGRVVGASVIYWLTRLLGYAFIRWLGKRFPAVPVRLGQLGTRLSHRTPVTVAIARLTPGLLTAASVAAGAIGLGYFHFVLGIALSSVIADGILLLLGLVTALGFMRLGFAPEPWLMAVGLMVLMVLVGVGRQFLGRRKRLKK